MTSLAPALAEPGERRQDRLWYGLLAVAVAASIWGMSKLDWALVWRVSPFLWKGLAVSFAMTGISIVAGLPLGILLAAGRMSRRAILRWPAPAIIEVGRATPPIMGIFWIYFPYPAVTGEQMSSWSGCAAALTLISGAYLAEVVRGGLLSIPPVQAESAEVIGL